MNTGVVSPRCGPANRGGDQLIVAGHHRGARGRGLARMVVSRRHLTGFRVQGVYSPAVMRAARWRDRPLTARADDRSFTTLVTDPPPQELAHEGRTYYLAHFNAYRAIYSPQPPPAELPGSG